MINHYMHQGTPEWHAFRAAHFTASDAPAMMGASPHKTRSELLREKALGVVAEIDETTQRRFNDGHRFELLARPLAEEIIGEGLYPSVGSDGKIAASFDGITLLEDVCWEHKTLNDAISSCESARDLPLHYRIQMEQQLMVSGAARCLFMASRWDDNDQLIGDPVVLWYEPDMALRQRIVDGWAQFERDLQEYRHVDESAPVVGRAPEMLPALRIDVRGEVVASNMSEFKARAIDVFRGIKTNLTTDEDFADAEKTTKWCKEVEDRLDAAKQHALSQTASIDELFRTIDAIKEEARQKRLMLEKLVKQRKESIRIEMIEHARQHFAAHVAALQAEIHGVNLIVMQPDFGGAIRGLKTIASIRNAIDTTLANAKIDSDACARDVRAKIAWFHNNASAYSALFPDLQQLIAKPMDDFQLAVASRIERHKKEEEARLEAERARIRAEEEARVAAARKEDESRARAEEDAAKLWQDANRAQTPVASLLAASGGAQRSAPLLKIGMINDRLGFTVTAEFLRSIGFAPYSDGAAKLYSDEDFPAICRAIMRHVGFVLARHHKNELADRAIAIKDKLETNDLEGAYELYSEVQDWEEKSYMWTLLDSKSRAAIKNMMRPSKIVVTENK